MAGRGSQTDKLSRRHAKNEIRSDSAGGCAFENFRETGTSCGRRDAAPATSTSARRFSNCSQRLRPLRQRRVQPSLPFSRRARGANARTISDGSGNCTPVHHPSPVTTPSVLESLTPAATTPRRGALSPRLLGTPTRRLSPSPTGRYRFPGVTPIFPLLHQRPRFPRLLRSLRPLPRPPIQPRYKNGKLKRN